MKLIQPDENNYLFTEGIDYQKTGKRSIWGGRDPKTAALLREMPRGGTWLHLAAGDGRYNTQLLQTADRLIAADVDTSALAKLRRTTPLKLRRKLCVLAFDMSKKFPLESNSLDGLFCVGALYLFPKPILGKIAKEIRRVVRPDGTIIIEFGTDIKRQRLDGGPYIIRGEPRYSNASAERTLRSLFKGYAIKIEKGKIPPESYPRANPPYRYTSNFVLMYARKL